MLTEHNKQRKIIDKKCWELTLSASSADLGDHGLGGLLLLLPLGSNRRGRGAASPPALTHATFPLTTFPHTAFPLTTFPFSTFPLSAATVSIETATFAAFSLMTSRGIRAHPIPCGTPPAMHLSI